MSMDRALCVVFWSGLLLSMVSVCAQAGSDPCGGVPCVAFDQFPVLSGGEPPLDAYVGAPVTVTGAALLGGLEVDSAVPGVEFKHLLVTTDYTSNLVFEPEAGSGWTARRISGGFELDAELEAHPIGQEVMLRTGGVGYYGLEFLFDATNSNGFDRSQLSSANFTFAAVPEPGVMVLGGLLVCGGLFIRSCRRK